jgi:hypothetical protein
VPQTDAGSRYGSRERLSNWFFWSLWFGITAIAALFYYGKAADHRSAFVRWQPQVLEFWSGVNIYDKMIFPNPPIVPILMTPFMLLPTLPAAMCWFAFKVALTAATMTMLFDIVRPPGKQLPAFFRSIVLLLSLRPILGDLHHANNNLVILFLIVAMIQAWRKGRDVLSGLLLALATSFKVTPALFFVYLAYKRSWRALGAAVLGMGLFIAVVPSVIIGPKFNYECLKTWCSRMVSPYVVRNEMSGTEINQSMPGVMVRLLTDVKTGSKRYDVHHDYLNVASLSSPLVRRAVKLTAIGLVLLLGLLCTTRFRDRTDPRLLGEAGLVVLTMLFVSERSWKHHYVTLIIPYTYLMAEYYSPRLGRPGRWFIGSVLAASFVLMAAASSEVGGLFAEGQGHEIAQYYGVFLWAGVLLYMATAWRVVARRREPPPGDGDGPAKSPVPGAHFGSLGVGRPSRVELGPGS